MHENAPIGKNYPAFLSISEMKSSVYLRLFSVSRIFAAVQSPELFSATICNKEIFFMDFFRESSS